MQKRKKNEWPEHANVQVQYWNLRYSRWEMRRCLTGRGSIQYLLFIGYIRHFCIFGYIISSDERKCLYSDKYSLSLWNSIELSELV